MEEFVGHLLWELYNPLLSEYFQLAKRFHSIHIDGFQMSYSIRFLHLNRVDDVIFSRCKFYICNLVNSLLTIRFYMKAARIARLNEPLQIQELQTPTAKGPQVLIKIQSTGVCHSDVHVWEGYYEGIEGQPIKTTDRGLRYPLTPGHEIAGIVDGLGEQAEGFSKNEKVLVYPWIGEGLCPACRIGEENLCDKPRSLGIYTDGGYAEQVLVPSYRYLVKIGEDMDMDTSTPLPCAGLTSYGAVKNANLKPDENVVIVGTGDWV